MQAVQYDGFGGVDVLEVRDIPRPVPGPGEVLVRVRAAGINPGEAKLRAGALAEMFPSTFPSGQGSDLAGEVIEAAGGFAAGDEVLGWVDTRSSHAGYAAVPAAQLFAKPVSLSWERAGSLFVAGSTAWAAVRAVAPGPGDTVVVAGAAGGVGGLAVQLAAERGATVIGLASERNHDWLRGYGAVPVAYGNGVADRIRAAAPDGVDALVDTVGSGYVDLALDLGVTPDRIDTIADFAALARGLGIKGEGSAEGANRADMTALIERLADGRLDLPVAATYPLAQVRDAFAELERNHTRGKIVLLP